MATRRLETQRSERAEISEHVESWATFILANLMWAIASMPIVTLPAATAGLFAVMTDRVRGQPTNTIGTFVDGMRQHWRKATALMVMNLLAGGLVTLNATIFPLMDLNADPLAFVARSVTLFAALALLMVNLYIWPLLVLFDHLSLKELLVAAARLTLAHSLWSLLLAVAALAIVAVSLLLPRGILALGTAAAIAWVTSWGAWRVVRQHMVSVESL